MKYPFDLNRALNGEAFGCDKWGKGKSIQVRSDNRIMHVVFEVDATRRTYQLRGSFYFEVTDESKDLFMYEPEFVLPRNWYVVAEDILEEARDWYGSVCVTTEHLVGMALNEMGELEKGFNNKRSIKGENGRYSFDFGVEITPEQFRKYVLNSKNNQMKEQSLKLGQLRQLHHKFSCGEFRSAVKDIIGKAEFSLDSKDVVIPGVYLKILYDKGTQEQKDAVTAMGINLVVDKNAFVKEFNGTELSDVSEILFGSVGVFGIARGSVREVGRYDLVGRSFIVHPNYKVTLHEHKNSTIIEINKK